MKKHIFHNIQQYIRGSRPTGEICGLALACSMFFSAQMLAQTGNTEMIGYAEHQPLVAQSLLLDIMQTASGTFVAVGERGHIVISEDGSDWTQADVVPGRSTLTVITEFGDQLWAAGHDSMILSSQDGGKTWTRRYFAPQRNQPIMDLHFTGAGRGIAIGAYGLMLVSTDGGDSWQDQEVSEEGWHLNAMADLGDGRLMIAGEAGFSYRSVDGGSSWETLEMPYPGSMFGIMAKADGCLLQFGLRGHLQQSCDFGDSWTELASGSLSTISGAAQSADGVLLVGNSGLLLEQGLDGGFTSSTHSSSVDFAAVITAGSGFLLVGEDGIYHYPEAGANGTD